MADAGLRQRKDVPNSDDIDTNQTKTIRATNASEPAFTLLDALRAIAGLILLNFLLSYFITGDSFLWGYRPWWVRPNAIKHRLFSKPIVLTDTELLQYNGQDETKPIYLALNGTIYDVTAGRYTYAPGGPYNSFAGRDAVRAYITGCFQEDAVPDLRGAEWAYIPKDVPRFTEKLDEELDETQRAYRDERVRRALSQVDETIAGWAKVFRGETGKEYFAVGRVDRKPGSIESLPVRTLCETAEKQRPKSKLKKTDPGMAYRKGQ